MSSSDAGKPRNWGSVYMGTTTLSLASVEGDIRQEWTAEDEAGYLERVRAKATEMAASLVDKAREEAESIREAARQEGYNQGMAQAEQEIEEFQNTVSASVAAVLTAIEGQSSSIFDAWRSELVALLRLAVEKGIGMPLVDDKAALLESLYTQAVATLENRRNLVIRVNPEDEPAIADIVNLTRSRYPDLATWSVKGDPAISPGGLVVESEDSLADNRAEKRAAIVMQVMSSLTLPPS